MNFINKCKKSAVLGMIMLMMVSCADEDLKPIITFDDAIKGAYVRLVDQSDRFFNLLEDVSQFSYTYSVEFVDVEKGALVTDYVLNISYVDVNPDNGDATFQPAEFQRFTSDRFVDRESGFKGLEGITITAAEMFSATGVSAADILPGDQFLIEGRVFLSDGTNYGFSNSSASVRSTTNAFQAHFNFSFVGACPSDLSGTFSATTTGIWCGADPVTTDVSLVPLGNGVYAFDDWSFGAYSGCYSPTSAAGSESLTFSDICEEVIFSGFTDVYGDTWTFDSSIDGADWTINWTNTYGESGSSVITHPAGAWPFTLK
ncbi:MAG: hypothetical protein AAFR66_02855 [Bacteroidota bacterium]